MSSRSAKVSSRYVEGKIEVWGHPKIVFFWSQKKWNFIFLQLRLEAIQGMGVALAHFVALKFSWQIITSKRLQG